MSFVQMLREAAASVQRPRHPWEDRLRGLRGTTGYDGVERVTTQAVLDRLEIPQRARNSATYLELARTMRALGWSPIRVRGLTRGGFREQVRGYARMR